MPRAALARTSSGRRTLAEVSEWENQYLEPSDNPEDAFNDVPHLLASRIDHGQMDGFVSNAYRAVNLQSHGGLDQWLLGGIIEQ